ncbi:MBL fold metallo-hydrolase [Hyalangium minutum]|uniref:Metal-dependent hydrolase of the beta-lactamase superfamily I n=1 Tax=Hyalangium minutum TaxID=394096 RepID=A0A085WS25_9BACT|nr:MBL fold metallo-hydrolase [Hyalangium minutum]KFE70488.1 Metal-dependent hydrolase of the beta-lactamase superfamily I [Hyalangium minutum]
MEVQFFGVRGSIAVSGSRIGGNTACVEVTSQGHRLILDAGTGIRALGEQWMREGRNPRATLFFSHFHWDHVQGFPFFTPAYKPGTELTLYGPGPTGALDAQRVLAQQMEPPHFPVRLSAMHSKMTFASARHGRPIPVGPFLVTPFEVPHPQGCLAYRIEADGHVFVYATDVELSAASLPWEVARYLEGADVLCLDAQYTPDEYEGRIGIPKKGWGHSTMVDAAQVAKAVGARRLLLFHHEPSHSDSMVERMAQEACNTFAASEPAREGQRIFLGPSSPSPVKKADFQASPDVPEWRVRPDPERSTLVHWDGATPLRPS